MKDYFLGGLGVILSVPFSETFVFLEKQVLKFTVALYFLTLQCCSAENIKRIFFQNDYLK